MDSFDREAALSNAATMSVKKQERLDRAIEQARKEKDYFQMQQYGMTMSGMGKKRHVEEDEQLFSYLEKDDDEDNVYQPAPGSPGPSARQEEDDDEDDPLDAFMAGVEVQAKKDKAESEKKAKIDPTTEALDAKKQKDKLGRADIDEEDMQESYFRWMEEHPQGTQDEEEEVVDYDAEGNPIYSKKIIDPLPDIDHTTIDYPPFERNFYYEHAHISKLDENEVQQLRTKLGIKASGVSTGLNPPKPVSSFAHFGFDEHLMAGIRRAEYTQPTPIQAQAIPAALGGRDVIGIAKTGSGKTVAYLWPALVHIMDQPELAPDDGPIALICVPTRELAIQVYNEAKKFARIYSLRVVCAYGGGSKWEQTKALSEGAEIVVCTPGRMIDMVKIGATKLTRVTYLVFDEADRMFDLGFEAQVRSIAKHVRPDRQCMLFSATFKKKVERLAREALTDPVRIVQGEVGEANEDVMQSVEMLPHAQAKLNWLLRNLVSYAATGKVLIFVTKKQDSETLAQSLRGKDFAVLLLHGDMLQHERNEVIQKFRKDDTQKVLVATDVAARGLDIPEIRTVVNYDVARDIDTHVHRIGRTGRAGQRGWAFTLVTDKDKEFAGHLVRNLESVNQLVPDKLFDLAMQSSWFKSSRSKHAASRPQKSNIGGRGLGYVPPAIEGAGTSSTNQPRAPKRTFVPPAPGVFDDDKPGSTSVSGSRLHAMKAAFSTVYKSKFQTASNETSWDGTRMQGSDPTSERKKLEQAEATTRKRKSRWEESS